MNIGKMIKIKSYQMSSDTQHHKSNATCDEREVKCLLGNDTSTLIKWAENKYLSRESSIV
jgi:hypothetical protein